MLKGAKKTIGKRAIAADSIAIINILALDASLLYLHIFSYCSKSFLRVALSVASTISSTCCLRSSIKVSWQLAYLYAVYSVPNKKLSPKEPIKIQRSFKGRADI